MDVANKVQNALKALETIVIDNFTFKNRYENVKEKNKNAQSYSIDAQYTLPLS